MVAQSESLQRSIADRGPSSEHRERDRPSARAVGHDAVQAALSRGTAALVAKQAAEGSWEGEVVWSAMLASELVLTCHLMGREIHPVRKRRLLLHFEKTRSLEGLWGLSEWSEPSLFVTTLVYVAARLLGAPADGPLLGRALAFLRKEDVRTIPSWGKFWLALMNLYGWEGVNPVSPAVWGMPRWLPIHPSKFYCHTRLIYLAMATLYGQRFTAPRSPIVDSLRLELYPNGFEAVDFARARTKLRDKDLYAPPTRLLWASYRVLGWVERVATPAQRVSRLKALRTRVRYELRTTNHTSISPVSGLLNVLALYSEDASDPDAAKAFAKLDDWLWEDDEYGARVTGARSSTWDTGFVMQALTEASHHVDVTSALARADAFLGTQQMKSFGPAVGVAQGATMLPPQPSPEDFDRIDPDGGFCFAGVWHGWPVSDCTAEAMLGRLEAPNGNVTDHEAERAVRFVLRTQNRDGGFGSYEPRRGRWSLESLNPAEMFGDSMTEASYVECTASCIALLATARPRLSDPKIVDGPIARAVEQLRAQQRDNGAWLGVWGVRLIYGTMFGIRGLLAGGTPKGDPRIRKACELLKAHQHDDGSWSEAHVAGPSEHYVEGGQGQVIQTAWAMLGLLSADDPDQGALDRAARFLAASQRPDGDWPQQAPAGVFFHTALLEYALYRTYFPVWALALYESRRKGAAS